MFKTLRGKINGMLALLALFTFGIVLANSDAGIMLQNWYDGLFNEKAATFNDEYINYLNDGLTSLETDEVSLITESNSAIDAHKALELAKTQSNIEEEKDEKINSLNAKKVEISGYMGKQFDDLLDAAKIVIDETSTVTINSIYGSVKDKTTESGKVSLTEIDTEVARTANVVVSELEAEIAKAKQELEAQLNSESVQTTEEVKLIIDNKIIEIRGLIKKRIEELTVVQQTLITQRSLELEESVKDLLDSAVGGI